MFIAALFTIAKTWNPSKRLSTDAWIKEVRTHIPWSTTQPQRNEMTAPAATRVQLEIIRPSEVGQKEKDKYHTLSFLCGT